MKASSSLLSFWLLPALLPSLILDVTSSGNPSVTPVMSFSYRPLEHPDFSPMALITVVLNHVFVFLPGPTLSCLSKTSSKRVMQAATGAGPWLPWLTNPFRAPLCCCLFMFRLQNEMLKSQKVPDVTTDGLNLQLTERKTQVSLLKQ